MKLTGDIGITTRNMHLKFEAVRRSYNFWRKNAYSAGPSKQDEIKTFSQCSQKIHETYRSYWNHHQKHACEIWGSSEKLQFLTEKCLQRRAFKTGWNFDIFSMFSKIHETYRSYWNHHQKHACEIWGSLEMLQFFREKCRQHQTFKTGWSFEFSQCSQKFMKFTEFIEITTRNMHVKFEAVRRSYNFWQKNAYSASLQNRMKFWLFLNVLQHSWNLQKLLESPPETCMWNLRQFGEVTFFDGKMPTAPDLQNRMKYWLFSMFSKIHEIYRIYWNHHQKHACEIWGSSEKLQFLTEKCLQRLPSKQDEILTFSQCSPKFMKLTEFNWITTRNMHVKFEAVRRSYNFWRKNAYSAGL